MRNSWIAFAAAGLLCLFAGRSLAGTLDGTLRFKNRKKHGNILVFLEKVGEKPFAAPREHAVVDQHNLMFIPYMLPVVRGTVVDFLNSDPVLHNVFTPDKVAGKFNLGTWPQGKVRSYTFEQLGSAVVLCNVHPEMEAYVVGLPNPYFAVTDAEGHFTLPSQPNPAVEKDKRPAPPELAAGTYILHAWHPKARLLTQEVSVPAQGAATVHFVLARGKAKNVAALYPAEKKKK